MLILCIFSGDIARTNWSADHCDKMSVSPHQSSITSLVYNEERRYFISSSRDKSIKLWDSVLLEKPIVISENAHDMSIVAMDENASNYKVWSGGRDAIIKLWDITKRCPIFSKHIERNIPQHIKCVNTDCDFNSNLMIECCEDLKLRIWDDRNCDVVQCIDSGPNIPLCCDVAEDGISVIVSFNGFQSVGCELKLFDMRKRSDSQCIWSQSAAHSEAVTVCKFIKSNSTNLNVLSGSKDSSLKVWQIEEYNSGKKNHCELQLNAAVNDLSVIDDVAYVASNNGNINVIKLSNDYQVPPRIIAVGSNQ